MEEKMTMEEIIGLVEEKQYTRIRQELAEWNEADIASVLEELPFEEQIKVFRILPKGIAADVFAFLPVEIEQKIITTLTDREAANIINNLMADDAADLMEEMPAGLVKKLLANADPEVRRDINHLLRYPEDSAGSLMTVEFVDLKENLTVAECIDRIRTTGVDKETIDTCYVLDLGRHLIGTVSLRDLLLNQPDAHVVEFMNENVISTNTMTDQEEVARMFQKYDLTTMPVVDNEGRLVGIITIDDVVDILQEEVTEDIEKMAAILPTDKPYMKTNTFETWKKRIPWLLLLMISATVTGKIITHYEQALGTYVVLTSFIPMLMDTGGNAGGQASVTIIRGLSLDEIEWSDIFKVIWKEIRVAVVCGITLAAVGFAKIMIVDRVPVVVALVVCLTLVVTVFFAKIVGCSLPMIAQKIGFDPAVMASPFITTIVDALSQLIYFQFATRILGI
ncbi:MAG: magnesium transporter [Lachnospiraceae bacterium]|nr:magnesium transporter [Lachnospiraceae bacterium]